MRSSQLTLFSDGFHKGSLQKFGPDARLASGGASSRQLLEGIPVLRRIDAGIIFSAVCVAVYAILEALIVLVAAGSCTKIGEAVDLLPADPLLGPRSLTDDHGQSLCVVQRGIEAYARRIYCSGGSCFRRLLEKTEATQSKA